MHNSFCNSIPILLKLKKVFCHGLKVCMLFGYNQVTFRHLLHKFADYSSFFTMIPQLTETSCFGHTFSEFAYYECFFSY